MTKESLPFICAACFAMSSAAFARVIASAAPAAIVSSSPLISNSISVWILWRTCPIFDKQPAHRRRVQGRNPQPLAHQSAAPRPQPDLRYPINVNNLIANPIVENLHIKAPTSVYRQKIYTPTQIHHFRRSAIKETTIKPTVSKQSKIKIKIIVGPPNLRF